MPRSVWRNVKTCIPGHDGWSRGNLQRHGRGGAACPGKGGKKLGMYSMAVPSRSIFSHKEEYIMNLALLCNALHKMAEEVYYTGLEEFGEVSEAFQEGTIGSSTMPQKINPKLAKGIIANSQKLYSMVATGLFCGVRMFEGRFQLLYAFLRGCWRRRWN